MTVNEVTDGYAGGTTEVPLDSVDGIVIGSRLVFVSRADGVPVSTLIEVTGVNVNGEDLVVTLDEEAPVPVPGVLHDVITSDLRHLTGDVAADETTLSLDSVEDIVAGESEFTLIHLDGTPAAGPIRVTGVDDLTLTLAAAPGAFSSSDVLAVVAGTARSGPQFWARNPGNWGADLRVTVRNSDRPPVSITEGIGQEESEVLAVASIASFYLGATVLIDDGNGTRHERVITGLGPGRTLHLNASVADIAATGLVQAAEIDILVDDRGTGQTEVFKGLSWNSDPDPRIRRRHYSTVINQGSSLVCVQPSWVGLGGGDPDVPTDERPPTPNNQPMTLNGFPEGPTAAGEQGDDGTVPGDRAHILGRDDGPGQRTGLQSLQDVDDISIIAAPGETERTVQDALITQAERMRYRFAVLDAPGEPGPTNVVTEILTHRNAYDSSYAAYYTPWVQIGSGAQHRYLPPSGHVVGVYARSDVERGVHKAPATK